MRSHAGHEGPLPEEVEQVLYVNGKGTVLTGEVLESQGDRNHFGTLTRRNH